MYEQNVRQTVKALTLGEPVSDGGLCIVPLHATAKVQARYVLLEQAIARGRMVITEVNDAGVVPYLQAVNKGPWPVLIFDGEELVGAKQNRIANATILVGVGKSVLPVSCVEQGRWSHRSQAFASGTYASHPSMRMAKEQQVRAAMQAEAARVADTATAVYELTLRAPSRSRWESNRSMPAPGVASTPEQAIRATRFMSDQGMVWHEVARSSRNLGVQSPTMAMADTYAAGRDDLDRMLDSLACEKWGETDDVVGVVVFVGGRFVCLDLLQPAKRFALLYPKLLRGYALEARMGNGHAPKDFDPEAAALRLFADVFEATVEEHPGVDLGSDLRLQSKVVSGAGLLWQDEVVQLSVFPRAGV